MRSLRPLAWLSPHHRYDIDKAHPVAKQFGIHLDTFLYGLEPLCLLLWWGDAKAGRAGVAKVMDGHRQMLARVQQNEATVDGCAGHRQLPARARACKPLLTSAVPQVRLRGLALWLRIGGDAAGAG